MAYAYDKIRTTGDGTCTFIKTDKRETPHMVNEECFTSAVAIDGNGPADFHVFGPVVTVDFKNALTGEYLGDEIDWKDVPANVKRRFNRWAKFQ